MTKVTQGPGPAGDSQIPAGSRDWTFWAMLGVPDDVWFESKLFDHLDPDDEWIHLDLGAEWSTLSRHITEAFGS